MSVSFEEYPIHKKILTALAEMGFAAPTPIQEKSLKPIMNGQQVVGIAQTGTGKTAAFGIPILTKLNYAQGEDPRALVIAPTRELAMQISEHLKSLAVHTDLRILAVYGGVGVQTQIKTLKGGMDVLVATPGRLHELYQAGHVVLKKIQVFVIDEADKMMDMGFISAIHQLLEVLPRKKQCLLFSATMTERVENLYNDFMEFPLLIETSRQSTPAETVQQTLYPLPNFKTKINLLLYLLENESRDERAIVFCKTKESANRIFKYLSRKLGEEVVRVIHGNKDQNSRIQSMKDLKEGTVYCLVATDVAARGIDIPEIGLVVNFDVPLIAEDYVHRIGRTGRAGLTGKSVTLCTPAEEFYMKQIEKLIRQKIRISLLPQGVKLEETPYAEQQEQDREIDEQRRKEDPDFKGAFHEKKNAKAILKKANSKADAKAGSKTTGFKKTDGGKPAVKSPKRTGSPAPAKNSKRSGKKTPAEKERELKQRTVRKSAAFDKKGKKI